MRLADNFQPFPIATLATSVLGPYLCPEFRSSRSIHGKPLENRAQSNSHKLPIQIFFPLLANNAKLERGLGPMWFSLAVVGLNQAKSHFYMMNHYLRGNSGQKGRRKELSYYYNE